MLNSDVKQQLVALKMVTVALYLSRSPSFPVNDPHCSHSVQCSVWVDGKDSSSQLTTQSSSSSILHYYSFVDDPSSVPLLKKLLSRIKPNVEIVYVAAESKIHSIAVGVVNVLSSNNKDKSSNDATADTGAVTGSNSNTRIQWLPQFAASTQNASRMLENVEQQLSRHVTSACARQAATDPTLSSKPVRLALALFWYDQSRMNDGAAAAVDVFEGTGNDTEFSPGALLDDAYLSLDATAAATLHLWPDLAIQVAAATDAGVSTPRTSNSSLYGILSQPLQTVMGQRCLAHWLRQPLVDLKAILHRQEAVAAFTQASVARDSVREGLRWNIDVDSLAVRIGQYQEDSEQFDIELHRNDKESESGKSKTGSTKQALHALYQLYLVAEHRLPLLAERLDTALQDSGLMHGTRGNNMEATEHSFILTQLLHGLQQSAAELHRASELAQAVLDLDQAPAEYLVRSTYSQELADVADELDQLQTEVDQCHNDMNQAWAQAKGTSVTNAVRLECCSDTEWQFRLPDTNDSKLLQSHLGSTVTVHRLLKNGVYFTTKQLRQLGSKKQDLLAEYDRHQRQVVQDAMKVAATYQGVLQRTSRLVATLDVLVAFAHVAAYHTHGCFNRPTLTDGTNNGLGIQLEQARHPCVELQDSVEYIPNDMRLLFGESSFLLVTGPNMVSHTRA